MLHGGCCDRARARPSIAVADRIRPRSADVRHPPARDVRARLRRAPQPARSDRRGGRLRGRCSVRDVNGAHSAVAFAAGASIASATIGASEVLTSMPAWATLLTGSMLAVCALRGAAPRRRTFAYAVCGVCAALCLPASPPPAPGMVSTRPPSTSLRGDLFEALDRLDSTPNEMLGSTISVTGTWTPASRGELATVSRRVVSCCAADAVDVGFDVRLSRDVRVAAGSWVRVDGTVAERAVDGDIRFVLEHSRVRGLEDAAKNAR